MTGNATVVVAESFTPKQKRITVALIADIKHELDQSVKLMSRSKRRHRKEWRNRILAIARQNGDTRSSINILTEAEWRQRLINTCFNEAFHDHELGETVSLHDYGMIHIHRAEVLVARDRMYQHPALMVA